GHGADQSAPPAAARRQGRQDRCRCADPGRVGPGRDGRLIGRGVPRVSVRPGIICRYPTHRPHRRGPRWHPAGERSILVHDHLTGALLGTATGDALGAGYEFTTPGADEPIVMHDGGPFGFHTGEWTDDTAMALAVAQAGAEHRLDTPAGMDAVARRFVDWFDSDRKDIGGQTFRVLAHRDRDAATMSAHAEATGPDNAGNGSLMRTAAVPAALAGDPDPAAMLRAAHDVSAL